MTWKILMKVILKQNMDKLLQIMLHSKENKTSKI